MDERKLTSVGGIVLCGGKSSRMGCPKAWLSFGEETALQRVVRILSEVVDPVVVVAAPNQQLPTLPSGVAVVRDPDEYLGPLAGIASGLKAIGSVVDAAYVTGCDVPLLQRSFVRAIAARLADAEVAVPTEGGFHHPLAGVYRTALAERARTLVDARRLRPLFLIEQCSSLFIPVEELRAVDPELDSLRNMNTPEEYERLKAKAGFSGRN